MKKNVPIFLRLLLLLSAAGLSFAAQAGGIALGATRVIYPQGSKQTSLPIINSSASNVFLIQSWVPMPMVHARRILSLRRLSL